MKKGLNFNRPRVHGLEDCGVRLAVLLDYPNLRDQPGYALNGRRTGDGFRETMNDQQTLRQKLEALRQEHRDLDNAISHIEDAPASGQLMIQRMKKRKLALRDQIIQLESQLIPDIIA